MRRIIPGPVNSVAIVADNPKKTGARARDAFIRYGAAIRGFIRKRVGNTEDTEDILQNVFHNLARLDESEEPIESISAWLYRVARNQIIDHGRKKREESLPDWAAEGEDTGFFSGIESLFVGDDDAPEVLMLRSAVWTTLEEALSELPAEQRRVFELNEMQDFSFREISESTGIPVNTLISRKRYAVLHLRERLSELYRNLVDKT